MEIKATEISIDDIPEMDYKYRETPRVRWALEVIRVFLETDALAWELCEGPDGVFRDRIDVNRHTNTIRRQIVINEFSGIRVHQRGKKIYLAKE